MVGTDMMNLQSELELARSNLRHVDDNIKKLIGRDPSELPPRASKRPVNDEKMRTTRMRGFMHENEEPVVKRRNSVFKRLSEKVEDDFPQKGLISKVIVTNKEVPSREEALKAQNKDEKFKARNRRMFGALMGTLQKFQLEETKLKPKEEKRAQLEKKIEEHEIKEKEEIKREKQELFSNRRKRQAEIKVIELKMMRMKEYQAWENNQKPRRNFIMTKAKPNIYYLPRRLTAKSKELLAESRTTIDDLIATKKQKTVEELQHIEERIKKNFEYKAEVKNEKDQNMQEAEMHHNEPEEPDSTVEEPTIESEGWKPKQEEKLTNEKTGEEVGIASEPDSSINIVEKCIKTDECNNTDTFPSEQTEDVEMKE